MKIEKLSFADRATDLLRAEIVQGRLAPGTRLTEIDLATQLGTGRGTVRAALAALEAEDLIVKQPYTGWAVRDISQKTLWETYTLRCALEGLADTLRIEISGHQAESGRLLTEINAMRHDRKETASRHNEVSAALTAAQAELKSEKRRNGDLQQKLERLMAELSDTQEKLERHSRSGKALSLEDGGQEDRAEIVRQNAALREEMAALAARVVAVTAEKEGPDSPIHALVQEAGSTADAEQGDKAGSKSLATRIRDLSKA